MSDLLGDHQTSRAPEDARRAGLLRRETLDSLE